MNLVILLPVWPKQSEIVTPGVSYCCLLLKITVLIIVSIGGKNDETICSSIAFYTNGSKKSI